MKTFDTYIIFEFNGVRVRILQDAHGLIWLFVDDFYRVLGISNMFCRFLIRDDHKETICSGRALGMADDKLWIRHDLAEQLITVHMQDDPQYAERLKQRLQIEIIQPLTAPKEPKKSPLLTVVPANRHLKLQITRQDYSTAINQLLAFAFKDTGASMACAMVLLTADNDYDYQLKFSDLISLDEALYSAALVVIRAGVELRIEPHEVISNGAHIFQELWQWWKDYRVQKS